MSISDTSSGLPAPPWQRVPQRSSGKRRDPLTQEAIVDAALKVLDAEGLEALSMRRVAEERDPEPERWREQLKEVGRTMRSAILRHRDIVSISIGRIPLGPNALRYSERVLAILRAGGVPDELAVLGHHLLISVVNGFTMDETGAGGEAPTDQPPLEDAARMVRDYLVSLPPAEFPNLVAVADHFAVSDPELRFELLLDLFVDGLAQRVEAASAATRAP
jgi:hypothetical protein